MSFDPFISCSFSVIYLSSFCFSNLLGRLMIRMVSYTCLVHYHCSIQLAVIAFPSTVSVPYYTNIKWLRENQTPISKNGSKIPCSVEMRKKTKHKLKYLDPIGSHIFLLRLKRQIKVSMWPMCRVTLVIESSWSADEDVKYLLKQQVFWN